MTWLCKTDEDGFILASYRSEEFATDGVVAPESSPPAGHVWRRVGDEWVAHEDKRGRIFFDPASPADALKTFTVGKLTDQPPAGWAPYGETQREQEGRSHAWKVVREQRNQRLAQSDWTQVGDVPMPGPQRQQWAQYRQALRDITNQSDPFNITWPIPPG
jgi:hypothetical protein